MKTGNCRGEKTFLSKYVYFKSHFSISIEAERQSNRRSNVTCNVFDILIHYKLFLYHRFGIYTNCNLTELVSV